jgi:formate dehydrogenase subunit beta
MIASIQTKNQSITRTLQDFFADLLKTGAVDAVLVPSRISKSPYVKPCLITSADQMDPTVPLGPGFFVNAGPMVSRLTRTKAGATIGVWLRPCEVRAFVELTKLRQGGREEVVILSMDCPMALSRKDYDDWAAQGEEGLGDVDKWIHTVYQKPVTKVDAWPVARACQVCEHPYPVNADMSVMLMGADLDKEIPVRADTEKGEKLLAALDLTDNGQEPERRKTLLADLTADRTAAFQAMDEEMLTRTGSIDALNRFFSACVNCHNCRSVCPVCYCKECVFNTDAVAYAPAQYLSWADKWGQVPLPNDTVFFHLTRLAHIGCTCVGCGQCTLACPSQIPVADLFISVTRNARKAFDYVPGRDDAEPLPLSVFQESEFTDIVGMGNKEVT